MIDSVEQTFRFAITFRQREHLSISTGQFNFSLHPAKRFDSEDEGREALPRTMEWAKEEYGNDLLWVALEREVLPRLGHGELWESVERFAPGTFE